MKWSYDVIDARAGMTAVAEDLLSVSIHRGVVPRSSMTDDLPRAEDLSSYKVVRRGDLVVNRMRAFQGAVGLARTSGVVSPDYLVLRPKPCTEGRYLHHLFRSDWFVGQMIARLRGIGSTDQGNVRTPRINAEDLGEIDAPLASVANQLAIADYLDTETARIDAIITKKRRMIELLDERWRAEAEQRMHALSRDFGSIALKRVVRCLDGKRVPLSGEERSQRQGEYPYYGASGAIDSIDDYIFDETIVLLGEDGAQLADPDYEIAFVVRGKVWVNNHAHVLRPIRANPDFLAFHLSTLDRGMFISGATREKITQADMNEIPVPDVPLEVQQAIAAELLTIRSRCAATSSALRTQLDLLVEHRQALVTAGVTGALSIPEAAC